MYNSYTCSTLRIIVFLKKLLIATLLRILLLIFLLDYTNFFTLLFRVVLIGISVSFPRDYEFFL